MDDLDAIVEAYESARTRGPANLSEFLPDTGHELYATVLRELVRLDLEYGWKQGRPRRLEEYQRDFPVLFQERAAVQELAFEEYRLRCQGGESPSQFEYQRRYQVNTSAWPAGDTPARGVRLPPINGTAGGRPPVANEEAWEALDHLLKELPGCDRHDEQMCLVLEAVRGSINADAVYAWEAGAAGPLVLAGDASLGSRWCDDFARTTIEKHADASGHLLLPVVQYFAAKEGRAVRSAALVRLSKTRPVWIVALRFDAARPLGVTEVKIMRLARRMLLNQQQAAATEARLKETLFDTIRCFTALVDARDPLRRGHSERVARAAARLGREMGLPKREQSDLYLAGLLHDLGKAGLSDQVLLQPGPLGAADEEQFREHPLIGDRLLAAVKHLAPLRGGVRNHHERYDGQGYPDRLTGKNIALLARVLAVVDACDGMLATRGLAAGEVDALLVEGAGTQWDPDVIDCFMACRHELYSICRQRPGETNGRPLKVEVHGSEM